MNLCQGFFIYKDASNKRGVHTRFIFKNIRSNMILLYACGNVSD